MRRKSGHALAVSDLNAFHVYVLWPLDEAADRPLYVGQSTNLISRLGQHLGGRFKGLVGQIAIEQCESRAVMDHLERSLIAELRPTENIALVPRPAPPADLAASRERVQVVACPKCDAEPGIPCVGRRGFRRSNHQERLDRHDAQEAA